MLLQNIIFPQPGVCAEEKMFFHADVDKIIYNPVKKEIIFDEDSVVAFDSYFNSFTIFKWIKYTNVKSLKLRLFLKGKFTVCLYNYQHIGNTANCKKVGEIEVFSNEKKEYIAEFPSFYQKGLFFFDLKSHEEGSVFYGGDYFTEIESSQLNEINIAINMCTYQREKYVERTVHMLNNGLLNDQNAEIYGHLHLFITDNGSSLDVQRLKSEKVHIVQQGDFGGAGGFTRGMMDILNVKNKFHISHIIMMDDDILIQQEAVIRTYSFLRLIKEKYKGAFIGGSLLRTDIQNVQTICGGNWSTTSLYQMYKTNIDLDNIKQVMDNELECGAGINGWWYECMPIDAINDKNLPNPVFFHMDDVEYDLRNCKLLINLNGICVWHEPFEYKPGSHLSYYNTRNIAITHAIHYSFSRKDMVKYIKDALQLKLDQYRYKEAALVLRGAEDFMRGIECLKATEPISLFEDIIASGYKKIPVEKLPMKFNLQQYYQSLLYQEDAKKAKLRRKTKNGYTKKPDHDIIVQMFEPNPGCFYRANRVLNYDMITGKAFITQRDNKQYKELQKRFKRLAKNINKNYDSIAEGYRTGMPLIHTREFWTSYLKINDKEN